MSLRKVAWAVAAVLGALCAIVLAVAVLVGAANTDDIKTTQIEGTPLGKQLLASSERVLDCTSPDGQCFKDGQERTAQAVGDINRVIVLAAACSVGLDPEWSVERRQSSISSCVIKRLAREKP